MKKEEILILNVPLTSFTCFIIVAISYNYLILSFGQERIRIRGTEVEHNSTLRMANDIMKSLEMGSEDLNSTYSNCSAPACGLLTLRAIPTCEYFLAMFLTFAALPLSLLFSRMVWDVRLLKQGADIGMFMNIGLFHFFTAAVHYDGYSFMEYDYLNTYPVLLNFFMLATSFWTISFLIEDIMLRIHILRVSDLERHSMLHRPGERLRKPFWCFFIMLCTGIMFLWDIVHYSVPLDDSLCWLMSRWLYYGLFPALVAFGMLAFMYVPIQYRLLSELPVDKVDLPLCFLMEAFSAQFRTFVFLYFTWTMGTVVKTTEIYILWRIFIPIPILCSFWYLVKAFRKGGINGLKDYFTIPFIPIRGNTPGGVDLLIVE